MSNFRGRVAIVTGASRNIGAECARVLAKAGAQVVLATRRSLSRQESVAEDIRSKGGIAFSAQCDIAIEKDTRRLVDETLTRFGRIDIVVNNAVQRCETPLGTLDANSWAENLEINVTGPLNLSCLFTASLRRREGGLASRGRVGAGRCLPAVEGVGLAVPA